MRWLNGIRVRLAQELLETTDHGVDRIAFQVGFASPTNFRMQFKRISGVAPQAYREAFRLPVHAAPRGSARSAGRGAAAGRAG
jgi:transcriptional regulator GlxA family with amidase domain